MFRVKTTFSNGFESSAGLEKMRETCRNHPALIARQNSFMVPGSNSLLNVDLDFLKIQVSEK